MTRKRKKRPNWPYRVAWMTIVGGLILVVSVQTCWGALSQDKHSHGHDWGIAFIASCLDATIAVWFIVVGASIGSFLNVVAYRLPLGRYIGGHSGCPYCQTPIDGTDNVPVLAWLKLRGRCRTCRLPISIQYPLVELAVAIIFFVVFVTEFSSSGGNLPDGRGNLSGIGFLRVSVTSTLVVRIVVYLIALSGLIAAALIAVRRQRVPLALYCWALVPLFFGALMRPDLVITGWRAVVSTGTIEARMDVVVTFLCGTVAAIAVARLLVPLLYAGCDPSLLASDPATKGARQFIGAMAVAGAIVGWQAVVPLSWVVMGSALLAVLTLGILRHSLVAVCSSSTAKSIAAVEQSITLGDMTVWVWLGLLVFRCGWNTWMSIQPLPFVFPEVLRHVLAALLLAPCAVGFRALVGFHRR